VVALVRHHGTHPGASWGDAACRRFLKALQEDGLTVERWGVFRLADQSGKGFGLRECLADHRAMLSRLEALADTQPPLAVRDLAVGGAALMAQVGRPGGPWLGQLQLFLLEAVLEHPALNSPEGLKVLARGWLEAHPQA
jgi:tRNA nucleotidyltransferase (CCA-adding enzyme)